jgi:hypothetical protein
LLLLVRTKKLIHFETRILVLTTTISG